MINARIVEEEAADIERDLDGSLNAVSVAASQAMATVLVAKALVVLADAIVSSDPSSAIQDVAREIGGLARS